MTATAARALARSLVDGDRFAPRRGPWRRTVAIGDPQARADKIFAVLAAHDLLADDGRLRDDVQLVSIGDHFDFGTRAEGTIADAQVDGPAVLRWLCAHGPAQVIVLVGNHDLARVDELAGATDARFAAAAAWLAERAARPERDAPGAGDAARADYVASFPELPAPGMVHRDLSAFTEAQQQLVRRELSAGRLALGATADLPSGRPALLTHAAITGREVALLGCGLADPPAVLAAALDGWLGRAVAAVAPRWAAGQPARLDLAPLHLGGAIGADDPAVPEGGGLLYHRPADPSRPAAQRSWEAAPGRPRRYHPDELPAGLAQLAGHTGHPKCVLELARWCDPPMPESLSGRRTLSVGPDGAVRYRLGAHDVDAEAAVLYLIDPSLHRAPDPRAVELFELAPGSARGPGAGPA